MDSWGHSIDYPLSNTLSRRFAATIHYPTTILPPGRRFAGDYPLSHKLSPPLRGDYPLSVKLSGRYAATIHYPLSCAGGQANTGTACCALVRVCGALLVVKTAHTVYVY